MQEAHVALAYVIPVLAQGLHSVSGCTTAACMPMDSASRWHMAPGTRHRALTHFRSAQDWHDPWIGLKRVRLAMLELCPSSTARQRDRITVGGGWQVGKGMRSGAEFCPIQVLHTVHVWAGRHLSKVGRASSINTCQTHPDGLLLALELCEGLRSRHQAEQVYGRQGWIRSPMCRSSCSTAFYKQLLAAQQHAHRQLSSGYPSHQPAGPAVRFAHERYVLDSKPGEELHDLLLAGVVGQAYGG